MVWHYYDRRTAPFSIIRNSKNAVVEDVLFVSLHEFLELILLARLVVAQTDQMKVLFLNFLEDILAVVMLFHQDLESSLDLVNVLDHSQEVQVVLEFGLTLLVDVVIIKLHFPLAAPTDNVEERVFHVELDGFQDC